MSLAVVGYSHIICWNQLDQKAARILDDLVWYDIASIWLSNPCKFCPTRYERSMGDGSCGGLVGGHRSNEQNEYRRGTASQLVSLVLREILSSQAASCCYDNVGPILR